LKFGNSAVSSVGELRVQLQTGAAGTQRHVDGNQNVGTTHAINLGDSLHHVPVILSGHPHGYRVFALTDNFEIIWLVPISAVFGLREAWKNASQNYEVVVVEYVFVHQVRRPERILVQQLPAGGLVNHA